MFIKSIVSALLVSVFLLSCAPVKKAGHPGRAEKVELVKSADDSTGYELIILDPGFQPWFDMNYRPIWYYSNDFLAAKNYQYVVAWNSRVHDPRTLNNAADSPFMLEIDYRPTIDYGIELNYKLYYYFKYIEATWGKILP
jgi:hypothetical protein